MQLLVALGVGPGGSGGLGHGEIGTTARGRQATAGSQPLPDRAVALGFAGRGLSDAQVVVPAVESDHGLPGRLVGRQVEIDRFSEASIKASFRCQVGKEPKYGQGSQIRCAVDG